MLTASGGPFRGRHAAELASVTVAEALAHPTWQMGPKITIDSSTLMNKGLEVIEAHELFGVDYDRIEVVVHPQSIVHSMVEFCDGATIAQLSVPDMRLPIGYALGYPERLAQPYGSLDFVDARPPRLRATRTSRPSPASGSPTRRAGRRQRAGVAERRQRGRRGGVPRRPPSWPAIAEVVAETLEVHEPTELVGGGGRPCRPTRSPGCGPASVVERRQRAA